MKHLPLLLLPLIALLPPAPAAAQDGTRLPFRMHMDFASFRYDESTVYLELYYAFPRSALRYLRDADGYGANVLMHSIVGLADGTGDPASKLWRVPVRVADTAGLDTRLLIGKVAFLLPPGKYLVSLFARDEGPDGGRDSVAVPFEVRPIPQRGPAFSDIELCTSIGRIAPDSSNIFYKNTLEVIPNPTLQYGIGLPELPYYAELYNSDRDPYLLRADVVSSYGKTVTGRTMRKSGSASSRVEFGSIPVGAIPSGTYTLVLNYCDSTGAVVTSMSKNFFLYNPDVPFDTAAARATASSIALEFAAMGEEGLDEHFEVARYIAAREERSLWSSLGGAEAKKKFLTSFWANRDTDPSTPRNEFFEAFQQRTTIANEQFRTPSRPGWKSDRGRVYIIYGKPDEVRRNVNTSDTKPTEVWIYDNLPGQGTAEFVFIDQGGFNDYVLVHSTHRNELSNPRWEKDSSTDSWRETRNDLK
jgi:GWxTD domain-containing protein